MQGVERLVRHKVPLTLKTVVLEPNKHEIEQIRGIADKLGVPFKFTVDIFPEYEGCKVPQHLAPAPEESAAIAVRDKVHMDTWTGEMAESVLPPERSDDLFYCKAGKRSFSIGPDGGIQFCLLLRHGRVDLRKQGFDAAWKAMQAMRALKKSGPTRCDDCELRGFCMSCPARNFLETGNPELPGDEQCTRTHAIAKALGRTDKTLETFLAERQAREALREETGERQWKREEAEVSVAGGDAGAA